jgi:putative transposase
VNNDRLYFLDDGRHVKLPVIGIVKTCELLRLRGKIVSGCVKRIAGRWHLSVRVEGEFRVPNTPTHESIGVDFGLTTAAVLSSGETFIAPKPLRKNLKKLARANRSLHRKKEGSANRRKARVRLAIVHAMIANVRKDFQHKATTKIVRETQAAILEDLNVAGMLKNHKLAQALVDVGMGETRRQIEYKGPRYGCVVHIADRWFPSSKICSCCGMVKDSMPLGQRFYECESCGLVIDRDLNAALNLKAYPGLPGNSRKATPVDTAPLLDDVSRRACAVAEAGTGTLRRAELPHQAGKKRSIGQ